MDPKKKEVLIQSLWSAFLNFLQDILVKKALAIFIKTAAKGGLKTWLITFIAEEMFDEVGRPTANFILVEVRYRIDVVNGKRYLKKLEGAASAEDYNNAVDDIYS